MIIIKGVVIENSKADSYADILIKKEIKQIILNVDNLHFDINHNCKALKGVHLVENYISDYSLTIADQTVNAGSWIVVLQIDNADVEEMIRNGELTGFSLFSFADNATLYADVEDKSEIQPLFVSLVENPANRLKFEVLDRDSYISKSKGDTIVSEEKTILAKIKELVLSADDAIVEEEEAPQEEEAQAEAPQEEDAPQDAIVKEEPIEEAKEDEPVAEEPQEEEAPQEEESEEEAPQEEDIEKEDAVTFEEIKELLLEILKYVQNEPEADEEPAPEEEEYIVKQATDKEANIEEPKIESNQKFDLFGRKL